MSSNEATPADENIGDSPMVVTEPGMITEQEVLSQPVVVENRATPPDRIAKLYADLAKALQHKDVGEKLTKMGADPAGSTPVEPGAFMKSESVKWARLIKAMNVRAE